MGGGVVVVLVVVVVVLVVVEVVVVVVDVSVSVKFGGNAGRSVSATITSMSKDAVEFSGVSVAKAGSSMINAVSVTPESIGNGGRTT